MYTNQIIVVVADDNKEFCGILSDYFSNEPEFNIIAECANGMEVLDVIENNDTEVLILDLIMPFMDGIGVMEKIIELEPG